MKKPPRGVVIKQEPLDANENADNEREDIIEIVEIGGRSRPQPPPRQPTIVQAKTIPNISNKAKGPNVPIVSADAARKLLHAQVTAVRNRLSSQAEIKSSGQTPRATIKTEPPLQPSKREDSLNPLMLTDSQRTKCLYKCSKCGFG